MSCFLFENLYGQDLSQINKSKAFSWQGSINGGLSSISNSQSTNYSPFAYHLGANASINIYGIILPLSFTYRNRTRSYTNPFNRFTLSPTYKWIKLQLGYTNLVFNPYVLSGVQIYGAGIELNPGKLRFGIVKGEIKNTKIIIDTLNEHSGILNPYKREGLGIRLGFGSANNFFDIMILTGIDKSLLSDFSKDSLAFKPQSNTTLGATIGLGFFKNKINFKCNVAGSGYTYNQNGAPIDQIDLENNSLLRTANDLFNLNKTTAAYFAGDASIGLNLGVFNIIAKYQRIDPQYQSFGIFYIRGDNENYTINPNLSLWSGKINLSASYGINQNNLHNFKRDITKQKVYNVSATLSPFSWGGIDLQLSNFNFNQSPVIASIDDSLRFIQINKSNSISPYFSFKNKMYSHNVNLNYGKQSIQEITQNESESNDAYTTNYSVGYYFKSKPQKYGLSASLYFTDNSFRNVKSSRSGITVGMNKMMLNSKLNNRIKFNYSLNSEDGSKKKNQYNLSLQSSYNYSQKGSLAIQAMYGVRPNFKSNSDIQEFRINTQIQIALK